MDGIRVRFLGVKLRHLEALDEQAAAGRAWYDRDARRPDSVRLPAARPGCRHVYHVFAVRTDDRDRLREALTAQGFTRASTIPIPIHLQPAHADLGYHAGDFPVAETVAREVLSLPLFRK